MEGTEENATRKNSSGTKDAAISTYMYCYQYQDAPECVLAKRSNEQHQPLVNEEAHEEIEHEVHQQAEIIAQPDKEIEDQTR